MGQRRERLVRVPDGFVLGGDVEHRAGKFHNTPDGGVAVQERQHVCFDVERLDIEFLGVDPLTAEPLSCERRI